MSGVLNPTPGPYVRTPIANLATYLAAQLPGSITVATIQSAIAAYVQANPPAALPLTAINPDFESNKAEMLNVLSTTNTWSDTATVGVGETFAEMVATAMTFNQLSIEKAVQESIVDTAVLDSSIYGITRMLGVKIQRMIPANVPIVLSNPISQTTTLEIPAYTQIQIGGVNYFNRTPLIIPNSPNWSAGTYAEFATVFPNTPNGYSYVCTTAGTTGSTEPTWPTTPNSSVTDGSVVWTINTADLAYATGTLYQGQVGTVSFISNGDPFQIFEFGNEDFSISNTDVNVSVGGVAYSSTTDSAGFNIGLWESSANSLVFEESTNAVGNVEIKFGNSIYGAIPPNGSTITVQFVSTLGANGNAVQTNQTLTCSGYSTVGGYASGPTTQGSNQISAYDYKNLGPGLYAAKYRAVTATDYNSIGVTYGGVIDALFLGQAIFAPTNLQYCMVVQVVLLTNTVWTTAQFNTFAAYMQLMGCVNVTLIQVTATPVVLNLVINLYCFPQADLESVQNQVIANLQAAFTLGIGSLGYSWYDSDYKRIITNTSALIDYFDIISPASPDDLVITEYQYVTLGTVTVNPSYSTRTIKGT